MTRSVLVLARYGKPMSVLVVRYMQTTEISTKVRVTVKGRRMALVSGI